MKVEKISRKQSPLSQPGSKIFKIFYDNDNFVRIDILKSGSKVIIMLSDNYGMPQHIGIPVNSDHPSPAIRLVKLLERGNIKFAELNMLVTTKFHKKIKLSDLFKSFFQEGEPYQSIRSGC